MARFEVPEGWTAQAYRFALDPTPAQVRAFRSHAGGARKAHNTMLAAVKAVLDQRQAERSYGIAEDELTPSLNWSLPGLRKLWNARKGEVAPWWGENSKEAYNTGLDALARGLEAWNGSKKGDRAGKAVGFPKYKTVRSRRSVRFTTGVIGVEPDRRHVTLLGSGRSRRTSPLANSPAASRQAPRGSCRPPCPRTPQAAGMWRSRPLCSVPSRYPDMSG